MADDTQRRVILPALAAALATAALGWLLCSGLLASALRVFAPAEGLTALPQWAEWLVVIVFGACAGCVLVRLPFALAAATALAALAVVAVAGHMLRRYSISFPWNALGAETAFALLIAAVRALIRLDVRRQVYEQWLVRYFSSRTVARMRTERRQISATAEKQVITVMFAETTDFTAMSAGEIINPVAATVTAFHAAVTECVHATDGSLADCVPGPILAFWNAPLLQREHAARACVSALQLQARRSFDEQRVVTSIAVHTGEAEVGNFGNAARIDYTAVGDAATTAERVAALNQDLGTTVLLTSATKRELSDKLVTRRLGDFRFEDPSVTVSLHELLGRKADEEKLGVLRDEFEYALQLFQTADFTEADLAFHRVLARNPNDGPTQFYLARLEAVRANLPDGEWDGVVEVRGVKREG